ncbi:MAG: thiamine phosphate synthase [Oscillospiraceae bacterium]
MNSKYLLLYAITDSRYTDSFEESVEAAVRGGATMIQLREKQLSHDELLRRAISTREICHKYGVPLIINDSVQIALESGADGVHLGQSDGSISEARKLLGADRLIGATAKTVEQALKAEAEGADYLGSGAMFPSGAKPEAVPMTADTLKSIVSAVNIPVCAIGGINRDNILTLKGTGICGAAVVSAIFGAADITAAAAELKVLAEEMIK